MFLEIENTTIGYNKSLVEGISTQLALGDVCLLIGNNGVGKTTLIKSILNQLPLLNHGKILMDRQEIKTLSVKEIAHLISIVFSKSEIPMNYTVKDLVSLGKYIHYPYYFELNKDDQTEIEDIIKNLGLNVYEKLQLRQLSDGNLQKAFIGRALAQNTPIIILDEPTTHLDENNKVAILKLLRNIAKKQNKIILFSSHDWRLAKEFADKIWYIKNGNFYSGVTEDILIQHKELTQPTLFNMDTGFVAPQIVAPELQKEMLYSVLQKNFNFDLSKIKFEFNNDVWVIFIENSQLKARNFKDIIDIIQNTH
ncbi:ABC transporter ATP-binding protein [Amniculibacterium sp. G2-70]|uniref:ABC transporter ATP-binding protein n=1 Tax=Amniculibacterium sp. G2-70 TaxID=2767188 RepID=UPI0016547288|nr:ABC transporter ATP-binding protein [Amniculibacterium sp. G2-70]